MIKFIAFISLLALSFSTMAAQITSCYNNDNSVQVRIDENDGNFEFLILNNSDPITYTKVRPIEVEFPGFLASNKWNIPKAALLFTEEMQDEMNISHLFLFNSIIPKQINLLCQIYIDLEQL